MKFHHWISLSVEWGFAEHGFFFIRAAYRRKYLKRRIMYSYGHTASYNRDEQRSAYDLWQHA